MTRSAAPPGHTRRSPGDKTRAPFDIASSNDCPPGYNPGESPRCAIGTAEPYAGPSPAHGPVGHVYLERLAARGATATVDLEAAFYELVDELGDDRARALLFHRRGQR